MKKPVLPAIGAALLLCAPQPLLAQESLENASQAGALAEFAPRPGEKATVIDYAFLDEALQFMVLRMGPSTRQGLGKPDPGVGTRFVYGHESRYRLEGNRVAFSFLEEETIAPLTDYLRDLERLGSELDIAALPRNEQLAYWINLHNVAVIEAIARNYPLKSPSRMKLDGRETDLDRTKLVTVGGVPLSPHDIRTRIVYPNWRNADVIYGFFRGEIGGPSIQRRAYTGANLSELLGVSAREFVNSLRGVESYGKKLLVSQIYEEAAPFYFPAMEDDLRAHLAEHAGEDVTALLASKPETQVNDYEDTIADLAGGERTPNYTEILTNGRAQLTGIDPAIVRLLGEREKKMEKLRRDGELRGRVIVLPPGGEAEPEETTEVE